MTETNDLTKDGVLEAIDQEIGLIESATPWPAWPLITAVAACLWTHLTAVDEAKITSQRYMAFFLAGQLSFSIVLGTVFLLLPPRNQSPFAVTYGTKPLLGRLTYTACLLFCLIAVALVLALKHASLALLKIPALVLFSGLVVFYLRQLWLSYAGRDLVRNSPLTKSRLSFLSSYAALVLWTSFAGWFFSGEAPITLREIRVMLPMLLAVALTTILLWMHDRPMPLNELRQIRIKLLLGRITPKQALDEVLEVAKMA